MNSENTVRHQEVVKAEIKTRDSSQSCYYCGKPVSQNELIISAAIWDYVEGIFFVSLHLNHWVDNNISLAIGE